jgi:glycosyltransferase
MKVSIITTCYNREKTNAQAIESVLNQDYPDIEYIVVDGGSRDDSLKIIRSYGSRISKIVSERDGGMYEAINKGIKMAEGDIVGLLHSDDFLIHNHIISEIVERFKQTAADMVYGDGLFVDADQTDKVIRDWRSGNYRRWKVRLGWLPLHPTVYIKRNVMGQYGLYNEKYQIAADSDFLLRYLYKADLKVEYLGKYVLRMRMGGLSTDGKKRKAMWKEDVEMFRENGFWGVPEKILKMCWKVPQFLNAKLKREFVVE